MKTVFQAFSARRYRPKHLRASGRKAVSNTLALMVIAAGLLVAPVSVGPAEARVEAHQQVTTLTPNGDGTKNTWAASGCGTSFWQCVDDNPTSADDDSTYVQGPSASSASLFLQLTNMPSDFLAPESVNFGAKFRSNSCTDDTPFGYFQLYQSNESTALTAETTSIKPTSSYNYNTRSGTLNGATDKSTWDGARLRLRQYHQASGGSDAGCRLRITAVTVSITYITTGVPKLAQTGYIFENDDEDQSSGDAVDDNTQQAGGNTAITNVKKGERITVRTQLKNTGAALSGRDVGLFYDRNDGMWTKVSQPATPVTGNGSCTSNTAFDCEIVDSTGTVGEYSSIAFDAGGTPWVAFHDNTSDNLRVAQYVGVGGNCTGSTAWSCTDVDTTGDVGKNASIAIGADGQPWVAFYDATSGNLRVAKHVGSGGNCTGSTAWSCTTVDSTGDIGQWTDIAINPGTNAPWISYFNVTNTRLKVAYLDGDGVSSGCNDNAWTCTTVDNTAAIYGTSIAFNPSGAAQVAYGDSGGGGLTVATYVGSGGSCTSTAWSCSVVDSTSSSGFFSDITMNSQGNPVIVHHDDWNKVTRVATYLGTATGNCSNSLWRCDAIAGNASGFYNSIAMAPDGNPWVIYNDKSSGSADSLKLARYDGDAVASGCTSAAWTCSTIEPAGSSGQWNSIAFGPDGRAWISSFDAANGNLRIAITHKRGDISYATGLAGSTGDPLNESHADMTSSTNSGNRDDADCIGGGTWNNGKWAESDIQLSIANGSGTAQCTEVAFVIDTSQAASGITYRFVVAVRDNWRADQGEWRGPISASAYPTMTLEGSTSTRISKDTLYNMPNCTDTSWGCQVVDAVAADVGKHSSMAMDPSGTPWIVSADKTNRTLRWAKFVGGGGSGCGTTGNDAWLCGTIDTANSIGNETAIVFDQTGTAWVAYMDGDGDAHDLRIARYVGSGGTGCASSEWTCEIIDEYGWTGIHPGIAAGSTGIWISYHVWGDDDLRIAQFVGSGGTGCQNSAWRCFVVDSTGSVGSHSAIALDSHGNPWVSYLDGPNGDMKVARHVGTGGTGCAISSWTCLTVDTGGADTVGSETSIAIDASGTAWVSYHNINQSDMKVARYVGSGGSGCTGGNTAWSCDGVETWDGNGAEETSIVIGPDGKPWISYQRNAFFSGDLRIARYVGSGGTGCGSSAWSCSAIDQSSALGAYSSLAFDRSGVPWISYQDWGNHRLKIAKRHLPQLEPTAATAVPYNGRSFSISDAEHHLDWGDVSRPASGACNAVSNNSGYCGVASADGVYDSVSTTFNERPAYVLAQSASSNADKFDVIWQGQSSVAPSSNAITVEVYRWGSTNRWESIKVGTNTCSSAAANTTCKIAGIPNSTTSEYWKSDGGEYWIYFRVTQAANATGATLRTDLFESTIAATPERPASLTQMKSDGTVLSTGAWNGSGTTMKFSGNLTDADSSDVLTLCLEILELGVTFTGTDTVCSSEVAYSGTGVDVEISHSLADGKEYHWRARVKDQFGLISFWQAYGGNAESVRDFGIDTTAPTGGTANDGTGGDANYNNGSLDTLSANWSGFNGNASGIASYDYSIGTSPGATDVLTWANTAGTSVTESSLNLHTSQPYYFNVRAIDNAGNVSTVVSSNGQYVAPTLTFSVSPGTITFDRLNAMNSFTDTAAATVTTSTNAYGGYVVRGWASTMTSDQGGSIPAYGGTWSSPSTWSGEGFGYTSSDSSVQGSNRFNNETRFAGFPSIGPGDILADHTSAVSGTPINNESFTITMRVTAPSNQQAGNYQSTIRFSAVAIF